MILPRVDEIIGPSQVHGILVGIIIPQIFAFLFLVGRIVSRVFLLRTWKYDDTLIVAAWVNTLAITILFGVGLCFGQGHHIEDIPLDKLKFSFLITYVTLTCYQMSLCLTKLSILVFYLRVFPARRERLMTGSTIIFVIVFSIPLVVGDILQYAFSISSSILHTTTDAWMILMILPVVSSLKIPNRQKYALIGVLSFGVFVMMASIARIVSILRLDGTGDITWTLGLFDVWTVLECTIGIACACAPTTRPLLSRLFPRIMSSVIITRQKAREGSVGIAYGGNNPKMVITAVVQSEEGWVAFGDKSGGGIYKSTVYMVEGGRGSLKSMTSESVTSDGEVKNFSLPKRGEC